MQIEDSPNLLPHDGEARYFRELFAAAESTELLRRLQTEVEWRHEEITIFGRSVLQPRLTAWYGDPGKSYTYSGRTMHPQPWTPLLLEICDRVQARAGHTFTSVLLNRYRDGQDSMGWHRDDEPELGNAPVIGSVSFGTPRTFKFRNRTERALQVALELEPGSLLVMRGETQKHWDHALPKRAKLLGERINLTFRAIV